MAYEDDVNTHVIITKDGVDFATSTLWAFTELWEDAGYWIVSTEQELAMQLMRTPGGKQLAYAEAADGAATQVVTSGSGPLDLAMVAAINFDVTDHPVEVFGDIPVATANLAGATGFLLVTDAAGVEKARAIAPTTGVGAAVAMKRPLERIEVPGNYTRKLQVNCIGASLSIFGPGLAGAVPRCAPWIRAVEC